MISYQEYATITYIYHEHEGNSSQESGCYVHCYEVDRASVSASGKTWFGACPTCGVHTYHPGTNATKITLSCGTIGTFVWHVTCASCNAGFHTYASLSHECYHLDCGKTEATIESAIITF